MIKKGEYCHYKGKEFKLNRDMEGNLLILSDDPDLIKEGFIDNYKSGIYSKKVDSREISACYSISTKGKIEGEVVNISRENEKEYYIGTSNAAIAKKLNLERTDKYYYDKWVSKEKIEVFEEKENFDI